ncbi:magnesium transporter CorA family protein [Mariniluteicoccus flavus]
MNVRIVCWRDGRRVDCPQDVGAIHGLVADPGVLVWVDLLDPDPAVLQRVADELKLDPHAVEDAVAADERPKATRHRSHTFITVYGATLDDDGGDALHDSRVRTSRVSAFVLPTALVTVRRADGLPLGPVEDRWEADPDLLAHGPGALVHGLMDVVVDGHFATIQRLDDASEELEDLLFAEARSRRDIQQRVYRLRKELVELRRVVLPMREVVSAVMRDRAERLGAAHDGGDHVLDGYFQDLYDHVMRATEWTDSLRDVVSTIFETNLSLQDAHLNVVMKKLAGWAAVIAVPTAVTGWFGQNIPFPGDGQPIGLVFSVVAILLGTIGVYALLRRFDWI